MLEEELQCLKLSLKMQFSGNQLHWKVPKSEITFKIKCGEVALSAVGSASVS